MIPLGAQPSIRTGRLIDRSGLANARMDKGSNAAGCRSGTLPLRYMETALACDRGESFTYRFTGRRIGMVRAMVRDGGRLACTLDGGRPTTVDFYDETVPTYERPYPTFLYGDLSAGPHDLACRVTDDVVSTPRGRSTGHKATIGYFLVSDEQAVTLP